MSNIQRVAKLKVSEIFGKGWRKLKERKLKGAKIKGRRNLKGLRYDCQSIWLSLPLRGIISESKWFTY